MVVGQNSAVDAEIIVFSPQIKHIYCGRKRRIIDIVVLNNICRSYILSVKKESESMFFVQNHRNVVPISLLSAVTQLRWRNELLTVIFCGHLSPASDAEIFFVFRILLSSVPDVSNRSEIHRIQSNPRHDSRHLHRRLIGEHDATMTAHQSGSDARIAIIPPFFFICSITPNRRLPLPPRITTIVTF